MPERCLKISLENTEKKTLEGALMKNRLLSLEKNTYLYLNGVFGIGKQEELKVSLYSKARPAKQTNIRKSFETYF